MPSIYQLKPRFQNLLRPLVRRIHAAGGTANQVTLLAALLSIALGACLAWWPQQPWLFALVPLWMFVRMALNAVDGMLAREFSQRSRLGAYLNELCDVLADAALFLPFALLPGLGPAGAALVVGVVILAIVSEYAGVLGLMAGASRRYDGPMGKSDRAFVFGALALAYALGWWRPEWQSGLMAVLAALLVYTCVNRVRAGLREASGQGS
ncbi:CDP-alcohol phosphatidyltransferase family protein [Corticibacter populi]|uniref:CDP-alcohol phosphatidyltransferase family protein n=1 Tax=Corticibacter populi TaxID=1550736 RepID=A0A3M6QSI4_9BURK|nr:CDP-alcohol phosphatidyltransferase family protein [Corticibacter populi]RMX05990.1 CDP-alcohol phosphatidyltransferase family protein [Corticibacter populi]RZS30679.1 CDP-diacylglycerol--glycerol-3-phosphate 3-phosphatidyltransferase [Corticibacter populi]